MSESSVSERGGPREQRRPAAAGSVAVPPPAQPKQAVVNGQVVKIDASYTREVQVPRFIVLTVLALGGLAASAVQLLASVLRQGAGTAGARRGWKDLRKGPEYLVTPIQVRDGRGRLVNLEIHGYLAANALLRTDQIRARVRRQLDIRLPPRVYHLANLTTGQVVVPRPPTVWSHLGPAMVLQAGFGLALMLVLFVCLWGVFL